MATFIAYNLLKLNGIRFENNQSIFFSWIRKYKKAIYILLLIAFAIFSYSFMHLSIWQQSAYVLSSLLAGVYFGIDKYNLRKYAVLKVPIVAIDWSILTVYTTLHMMDFTTSRILIFVAVYCLIAGLTIPFEIRDANADRSTTNHKTLFQTLGENKLKILSIIHLLIAFVLFVVINLKFVVLLPLFIVTQYVIIKLSKNSSEYNYTLLLDGVLVLFYPIICLMY